MANRCRNHPDGTNPAPRALLITVLAEPGATPRTRVQDDAQELIMVYPAHPQPPLQRRTSILEQLARLDELANQVEVDRAGLIAEHRSIPALEIEVAERRARLVGRYRSLQTAELLIPFGRANLWRLLSELDAERSQ